MQCCGVCEGGRDYDAALYDSAGAGGAERGAPRRWERGTASGMSLEYKEWPSVLAEEAAPVCLKELRENRIERGRWISRGPCHISSSEVKAYHERRPKSEERRSKMPVSKGRGAAGFSVDVTLRPPLFFACQGACAGRSGPGGMAVLKTQAIEAKLPPEDRELRAP